MLKELNNAICGAYVASHCVSRRVDLAGIRYVSASDQVWPFNPKLYVEPIEVDSVIYTGVRTLLKEDVIEEDQYKLTNSEGQYHLGSKLVMLKNDLHLQIFDGEDAWHEFIPKGSQVAKVLRNGRVYWAVIYAQIIH